MKFKKKYIVILDATHQCLTLFLEKKHFKRKITLSKTTVKKLYIFQSVKNKLKPTCITQLQ